jgi:hypothetical protein
MNRKSVAIIILAGIVLLLLFSPKSSGYGMSSPSGFDFSLGGSIQTNKHYPSQTSNHFNAGEGAPFMGSADSVDVVSATSLIPRDVVGTEDFGQFSPDKILGNQNYLDPRNQIGYPETLGGVLRNANRDFRSEPLNPRKPVSIFNLSTIPPDVMRPKFEIGSDYM